MVVLPGETFTSEVGAVIVKAAELEELVCTVLVAVTVTVAGLGIIAGAT
jgi:hypothetical protein